MSVFVDDKEMAEDRHVASKQRGVMRQLRLLPPVHQQKHDHHAAQHERDVEHALMGRKRGRIRNVSGRVVVYFLISAPSTASNTDLEAVLEHK